MINTDEILSLDALGQKALLDRKQITPSELTDFYINRIQADNPSLNAIVTETFEQARKNAQEVNLTDSAVAGLPFLIKDLNAVKGVRFTHGSRILKDFAAPADDEYTLRYQRAGLISLGKTNTPEFGLLPTTEPELFGPTKNPWDHSRSPGGSSGGSAAAVAAGLIPFAHANDGGGSIRIPASSCGLFGLKPSRGRLPYSPYVNHLAINHALTRSVRDSAALLDVIKGGDKQSLYPSYSNQTSFLESVKRSPRKLKIAVGYQTEDIAFDEATKQNMEETTRLLEDLGHEVHHVMPTLDYAQLAHHFINIWLATGSVTIQHLANMAHQEPTQANLEPLSYQILQFGKQLTAFEYEESRVFMQIEAQKLLSFFDTYDMWMTPTLNQLPVQLGTLSQEGTAYQIMLKNMTDYNPFMPLANATGQPAMSVPTSFTKGEIPIGTHFIGRPGEEAVLLQLGAQLEKENPWFHRYAKFN
ncbi:amidase [Gracilibacillus caseinilyticus]|uniref:Amidase n=1 Tax=Gracilibacillus caseinilyticus TaxID=2932256 RepID=A0ABY4EY27_9BACI|nr:amidase [Gracilibacillus caseinilyticus]UOQ49313.1 amidase [Gracilibacillus caseinilyticus]